VDLTAVMRRRAMARPAVLLVVLPGATGIRLALERELRRLRWPRADGPAAANLLAVAGRPQDARAGWLDALFGTLPHPRARVTVTSADEAAGALGAGHAELLATPGGGRHVSGPVRPGSSGHRRPGDHEEHHGHQEQHGEDGEHGQDGMDGHGGMDGMLVAGLPMAERAADRDGLRLDRLHLPLGPALRDWPAGLVLRLALQGDVVQSAGVDRLPGPEGAPGGHPPYPFWNEPWLRALGGEHVGRGPAARRLCAAHLDSAGRLLGVAGWAELAASAHRLRDEVLAGATVAELRGRLDLLIRRGERSRTLRALLRGLGPLPASRARDAGVTGPALAAGGDAYDRFRRWLAETGRLAAEFGHRGALAPGEPAGPRGRLDGARAPSRALLDVLPGLLEGAEFAGARLIVASLDPDLDEVVGDG
jgi:hypothetical protein